ncbi:MAG: fumarylacetoacetate hydrolase family protein [Rhodobacteraceae bacterium]|nr:fumarylacetoacetate hydrolase family protein [Paracoccaceae bacterium]
MKIGSFLRDGRPCYGTFDADGVAPVGAPFQARYPGLRDVLDAGALDDMAHDAAGNDRIAHERIVFLPPVPNPRRIVCVGMNYRRPYPVDGVAAPDPQNPILFAKDRAAMVAHGQALETPRGRAADSFDYEGEIAVVIGRTARHVPPRQALSHVLGYAPFNDGSVRDWQRHSIHAGKSFANSGAWGPWITTADSLGRPEDLRLSVRLNEAIVQQATGGEMIFSIARQIAYASHLFPLEPGDVIATGSPDGTGGSRTPKRYLTPGDRIEVRIDGIGTLINSVAPAP